MENVGDGTRSVVAEDQDGRTPLYLAAERGEAHLARLLLEARPA